MYEINIIIIIIIIIISSIINMLKIFETVAKRDSNPGSLDCESGILRLS